MRARLLIIVLGLLALTGCSSVGGSSAGEPAANKADATFSLQMIPHHRQTIQIAKVAMEKSKDEFVVNVADKIATAEAGEIEQMATYLRSWNIQVPGDDASATHKMAGMMTVKDVEALKSATGKQYDDLFLATLSRHLRSGVDMAKEAQAKGEHIGSKALASKIIVSQTEVLDQISAKQKS
ncbi:DUF305 domain-containing protein [Lentzea sp. BCCO 10_0798]|jgi:uncharacterized protein (DUF305 family)|uniref:DUF305 domain-containing protein n=1 Tax=Lentzea kristufekii TaxID=3095430 RepID=A0ABU4U2H3_9PSEU|nr:DUF305 domain-containing protein [Lentzea sp. BCCO 10_0798]MDX8054772.1 DUF305 domain-containing protein [Lentzea sp. BCCO 10_0798]